MRTEVKPYKHGDVMRTATPDLVAQLALTARCVLDDGGISQGQHRTNRRGGTAEFVDYRMYSQGDDASQIDWKVFGKTDRLYIRSMARMSDLTVQLIVDASPSMHFADPARNQKPMTKYAFASALAASLALLALRQRDRSMLNIIGTATDTSTGNNIEPGSTYTHYTRILHALASHIESNDQPSQPTMTTTIGESLTRCYQTLMRPARRLVFVFSDLLDDVNDLAHGLSRFAAARCDVVVCQILTPVELSLTGLPRGTYLDPEFASSTVQSTARPSRINADPNVIRQDYINRINAHINAIRHRLQPMNIEHRLLLATPPGNSSISLQTYLNSAFKSILGPQRRVG